MEEYAKYIVATFLLPVVTDLHSFILVVVLISLLNFTVGLKAGLNQGEHYDHKKAWNAVKEFFVTTLILFFIALTCQLLEPELSYVAILRVLTGLFAVIYGKNITKNLKIIVPHSEFVVWLDKLVNSKYFKAKKKVDNDELEIPKTEK